MSKFWPKPPETIEELTAEVERLRQSWDIEIKGYEEIAETAREIARKNADLLRQRDALLDTVARISAYLDTNEIDMVDYATARAELQAMVDGVLAAVAANKAAKS